jgi:hypothetical protein
MVQVAFGESHGGTKIRELWNQEDGIEWRACCSANKGLGQGSRGPQIIRPSGYQHPKVDPFPKYGMFCRHCLGNN